MAKYVDTARKRIESKLRAFSSIVAQAKQRSLNEADTRDIVKAMIGDLLGFDPFFEVTGEFSVKGQYADFAVKSESQILLFVEVKSIGTKLDERHLFQVIGYAANHGVEWAILTNADEWLVYRLFAGDEKRTEPVLRLSISSNSIEELTNGFLMCSKEGFRQSALSGYWSNMQALSPRKLAATILEPSVISALRRELQKTAGFRLTDESVRDVVLNQVMRGDLADSLKSEVKSKPKPKATE